MDEQGKKVNQNKTPSGGGQVWWQPALVIFFKFSGWIVAPLLVGIYLGKWLDRKYSTEPWLFLISVGAAFIISIVGLVITVMRDYRRIEKEGKTNGKSNSSN